MGTNLLSEMYNSINEARVSNEELQKIVDFIKQKGLAKYREVTVHNGLISFVNGYGRANKSALNRIMDIISTEFGVKVERAMDGKTVTQLDVIKGK